MSADLFYIVRQALGEGIMAGDGFEPLMLQGARTFQDGRVMTETDWRWWEIEGNINVALIARQIVTSLEATGRITITDAEWGAETLRKLSDGGE